MTQKASHQLGRADLHMHTNVSDGLPTVQELLDYVERLGTLDVIAITDHDTLNGSLWAYERREKYPFDIIPGLEITSAGGHVLGWWVTQPIPRDMSLAETVAAIHEQGGIAMLAHPYHVHMPEIARHALYYYRHPEVLVDAGLDALEVHNAGVFTPWSNRLARRTGKQTGLAPLGNSDAHTLGAIGSGSTRFPGKTASDLRTAIESGQTIAEGRPWPLKDYWQLLTSWGRHSQSKPLEAT